MRTALLALRSFRLAAPSAAFVALLLCATPRLAYAQLASSTTSPVTASATLPPAPAARAEASRPRFYGDAGEAMDAPIQRTRRGGFTAAVLLGGQVASARGTPTQFSRRNDAYAAETGMAIGSGGVLFLGVTFTDYLGFHVGVSSSKASHAGIALRATAFLLGIEAWPFITARGPLRDLGFTADFGSGGATITRSADSKTLASAGAGSIVRVGAFFEALRSTHLNAGPFVALEHEGSDTYAQTASWLGVRLAYQSGP